MQHQKYVELFSTNDKLLLKNWKIQPSVKEVYHNQFKSLAYNLRGKTPIPLMNWAKDKINGVNLCYPILVLQIYFPNEANIVIDVGITLSNRQRMRIALSSTQKLTKTSQLSVTLPIAIKQTQVVSHFCIDLEDIAALTWKYETFRSVESLALGGVCDLKRIFTLKREMILSRAGTKLINYDQLPKHMRLAKSVIHTYQFVSCSGEVAAFSEDRAPVKSLVSHGSISSPSCSCSSKSSSSASEEASKPSIASLRSFTSSLSKTAGCFRLSNIGNTNTIHGNEPDIVDQHSLKTKDIFIPSLSKLSFSEKDSNACQWL